MPLGLDLSFSRIPGIGWVQARKSEGVEVIYQCVWTGGYSLNGDIRRVAEGNLRLIREGGCIPGVYSNASPSYTPEVWLAESITNMGAEASHVKKVMIDIELGGIDPAQVIRFIQLWKDSGYSDLCTYSADWFVAAWGQRDFGLPYVHARYDGNPDIAVWPPRYPLGPLGGKQYRGSHIVEGVTVDALSLLLQEDDMALSPAATQGIEDFYGKEWTDKAGNTWPNVATFVTLTLQDLRYDTGTIPQGIADALAEISALLQNPPLGDIAKAVANEQARRLQE